LLWWRALRILRTRSLRLPRSRCGLRKVQKRSLPPPGDVGPLEEMVEPRPDAGVVVEGEEEEEVRPLLSAFRDEGGRPRVCSVCDRRKPPARVGRHPVALAAIEPLRVPPQRAETAGGMDAALGQGLTGRIGRVSEGRGFGAARDVHHVHFRCARALANPHRATRGSTAGLRVPCPTPHRPHSQPGARAGLTRARARCLPQRRQARRR